MSRPLPTFAVLLVTLVASFAIAAPAHAAVVPWEVVGASLHDEGSTQLLVVSGTLPAGTKLPAQVELPVPKSSQLSWVGEVLGGPVENDPSAATTTRVVGDAEVHSFTLTKSLTGQVEVLVPGTIVFDGSAYATRLTWIPVADAHEVTLEVRVPSSAEIVTPAEGAKLVSGPGGESAYRKVVSDARAGQPLTLEFVYTAAAPAAGTAPVSGGGSGTVVLVVVLGVVIAAALIVVVPRRMRGTSAAVTAADVPPAASEQAPDDEPEAPASGPVEGAAAGGKGRNRAVIVLLVVGAILALVVFSMATTRQTQQLGGELSREYAQGDACTKASIRLAEGADSEKVLTALESAQVIRAAIVPAERTLQVEFCDSQTTEGTIRAALAPIGVLE